VDHLSDRSEIKINENYTEEINEIWRMKERTYTPYQFQIHVQLIMEWLIALSFFGESEIH
jgi:hypothetical protein